MRSLNLRNVSLVFESTALLKPEYLRTDLEPKCLRMMVMVMMMMTIFSEQENRVTEQTEPKTQTKIEILIKPFS